MEEHPRSGEISSLLEEVGEKLQRSWEGFVYRCVAPKWARPEDLISGKGTFLFGSRWMRPGVLAAVYAATTESIALKESRRVMEHFGIARPKNQPRIVVEMEVTLKRVADLSRINRLFSWPGLEELLSENWEATNANGNETLAQAMGRALVENGFSGLIVPSTRDRRGRNLAWFPEKLRDGEIVSISGKTELEQWIAK